MEYETEEQQVEALKSWWAENGKAVIAGVFIGVAVIGGWSLWTGHVENKTVAASDAFSESLEAVNSSDVDTALLRADEVQDDNPGHLYASYAAMTAARAAVENGDLEEAAKRLEWVSENAPQDDVRLLAKVRLARVQGSLGDAAAGLSTLPKSYPESFTALVEEARGDLHVYAGDEEAARVAYQAAVDAESSANPEGLTMKMNELAQPSDASDDSESTS